VIINTKLTGIVPDCITMHTQSQRMCNISSKIVKRYMIWGDNLTYLRKWNRITSTFTQDEPQITYLNHNQPSLGVRLHSWRNNMGRRVRKIGWEIVWGV